MEPFSSTEYFWYITVFSFWISVGVTGWIQCHFMLVFLKLPRRWFYYLVYLAISYGTFLVTVHSDFLITQNMATLFAMLEVWIFVVFLLRQPVLLALVTAVLTITGIVLTEGIVTPLNSLFVNTWRVDINHSFVIVSLIGFVLTYVFFRFFAKNFSIMYSTAEPRRLFLMAMPLLLISIVMRSLTDLAYAQVNEPLFAGVRGNAVNYTFLGLAAMAFLCVWGSLMAYKSTEKQLQEQGERMLIETQLAVQKTYAAEARKRYESTRAFRHDFNNHLLTLRGLLELGEQQKARAYLEQFERISEQISFSVCTGNIAVDVLLGEKLACAKQDGIQVLCDVMIPDTVEIEDFDLCTLLSNALDNGIRGCNSVMDGERWLDIAAKQNRGFFVLDVINTYDPVHMTSHTGIGISAMKVVAEKYDGVLEASGADGRFRLSTYCVHVQNRHIHANRLSWKVFSPMI